MANRWNTCHCLCAPKWFSFASGLCIVAGGGKWLIIVIDFPSNLGVDLCVAMKHNFQLFFTHTHTLSLYVSLFSFPCVAVCEPPEFCCTYNLKVAF